MGTRHFEATTVRTKDTSALVWWFRTVRTLWQSWWSVQKSVRT